MNHHKPMMLSRGSLHNNNSSNNKMLHANQQQANSYEAECNAFNDTALLTASTATLLGMQTPTSTPTQDVAIFYNNANDSKDNNRLYNEETPAVIEKLSQQHTKYRGQHNYSNYAFKEQASTQHRNHTKQQLPGYVTRQNSLMVQPVSTTKVTREKISPIAAAVVTSSKAIGSSIRRIRRPRQWIYPAAETDAAANDKIMMKQEEEMLSSQYSSTYSFSDKCKSFIIEFLQGSSIHGFVFLAKVGLNLIERMIWLAFICVALFSIISLSNRTWERFQTSPMVISMDRNKLVWNTSFPSLTVCPHKRIDELKVEEYMLSNPEHFQTAEDKDEFQDFIVKLAGLSYENIETLPMNKTFGLPSDKYLDILYELKWNFEPELSSGATVKMYIFETLTEFGICHSVNSLVARYNSYDYWRNNDWQLLEHGDHVTVHPLDGEIYGQIINLSTAYDVYFHGSGDIPSISKQRYTFPESDYTTVELIALEIFTAEDARAFTTKQRKCRFQYESEDMLTVPIYTFGLCQAECRMFFVLKVCGCVPHFYRHRLRTGKVLPVCGFEGLACLAKIKGDIISLKSNKYKVDCNCLSNCDDSNFFVQSFRSRVWFLGANLQWGIIDYPKMQLRRDVLFSFADVLVYIGGLVGFFLGCSALSFTEVIYYFTARFIRRIFFDKK